MKKTTKIVIISSSIALLIATVVVVALKTFDKNQENAKAASEMNKQTGKNVQVAQTTTKQNQNKALFVGCNGFF